MIRLSFNSSQGAPGSTRLNVNPKALVFANSGSSIEEQGGALHKGVCIGCNEKPCIVYSDQELFTPLFQAFPHNTSQRVCPTQAISFDASTRCATINPDLCFTCGLCIHRCPTAAIQIDFQSGKCSINTTSNLKVSCSADEAQAFIENIKAVPHLVHYDKVPAAISEHYQTAIASLSKSIPDISEIIVRNTLVNMGIPCNATAAGNNHIRTEFFGQETRMIIIGESNSSDTDTLSVTRRIMDDEAVMIGRYKYQKNDILPLSVINGLPNKRTDYYEVIQDIKNILGIQIYTVTFHVLFLLNLFNKKLRIIDFGQFIIDKNNQDLATFVKHHIPRIDTIDESIDSANFKPIK